MELVSNESVEVIILGWMSLGEEGRESLGEEGRET